MANTFNHNDKVVITDSGSVGIGTTSPQKKLDVRGGYFVTSDGGTNEVAFVQGGNGYAYFGNLNSGKAAFGNSENWTTLVADGGKVGIGTTSPGYKLEVQGTFFTAGNTILVGANNTIIKNHSNYPLFEGQSASAQIFFGRSGANPWGIGADSTYAFRLWDSTFTTGYFEILTNGNVGIGTTSPAQKLHVEGSVLIDAFNAGNETGIFFREGFYNYNVSILAYDHNGDGTTPDGISINGYDGVSFSTGSNTRNERMRITQSGNVGIGTTSPSYKLEIGAAGSGGVAAKLTQGYEKVRFNDVDLLGYPDGHLWMIGNNNPSIVLSSAWDWDKQVEFAYFPGTVGAAGGELKIGQTNKNNTNWTHGITSFITNGSERMRINASGKVGIGTTTPSSKLHVYTASGQANVKVQSGDNDAVFFANDSTNFGIWGFDNTRLSLATNSTERVSITGSGNVGIGTTSPVSKLQVEGDIALAANGVIGQGSIYGNSGNSSYSTLKLYDSATGHTVLNNQSYDIQLNTAGGTKMIVKNGGNVGIGTTSPEAELDVNGRIAIRSSNRLYFGHTTVLNSWKTAQYASSSTHVFNAQAFVFNNEGYGSTEYMRINTSGNVGIGTTSPGAHLHVSASSDAHLLLTSDNAISIYQDSAWSSTMMFGAKWNGSGQVYGGTSRGAFKIVALHDADNSPQYLAIYGANQGTAGNEISWNSVGFAQDEDGNVGIGTTSPAYKLDVNGGIKLNGKSALTDSAYFVGAPSYGFRWNSSNDAYNNVIMYDNGNMYVRGNVGIGTTSPAVKLDVRDGTYSNSRRLLVVDNSNAGTLSHVSYDTVLIQQNDAPTLRLYESGENLATTLASDNGVSRLASSGNLAFHANGTYTASGWSGLGGNETMRITNNNVGIGTTSPGSKLDVNGRVNVSGEIRSNGGFTNEDGNFTRVLSPGGAAYSGDGGVTGAFKITLPMSWSNTMMRMTVKIFDYSAGESFTVDLGGYNYTGSGGYWANTFSHTTCDSGIDRNFTVRFGHDGTKNCIYIGELTSSWSYPKIAVVDAQFGHSNIESYRWNDGWDIRMETSAFSSVSRTIQNTQATNWKRTGQDLYYGGGSGRVGIGTTSPSYKLSIAGTSHSWNVGPHSSGIDLYSTGNIAPHYQSNFDWYTGVPGSGSFKMRLDSSGNLGIGTSSPGYKLDVSGGAIAIRGNAPGNSLRFDDSAGTSRNAFYVDTSNYLNIGNANYAGVKFVQTASAPTAGEFLGIQIQSAIGVTDEGVVLAAPDAWLAVRVGTVDYAIPMYTTG